MPKKMNFSEEVSQITMKSILPRVREDIKNLLLNRNLSFKVLGIREITGDRAKYIEEHVESLSDDDLIDLAGVIYQGESYE